MTLPQGVKRAGDFTCVAAGAGTDASPPWDASSGDMTGDWAAVRRLG